jgi:hypothetical protein
MESKYHTLVHAVRCRKCGDIIYSRARHDFRWCSCQSVAVDGGFEYTKICGNSEDIETFEHPFSIDASEVELYNDWNGYSNKYGKIKKE